MAGVGYLSPRMIEIDDFVNPCARTSACEQRYRDFAPIASPRWFLGALNAAIGTRLGETVRLRISKNLARSPANEIREALPNKLFERCAVANG